MSLPKGRAEGLYGTELETIWKQVRKSGRLEPDKKGARVAYRPFREAEVGELELEIAPAFVDLKNDARARRKAGPPVTHNGSWLSRALHGKPVASWLGGGWNSESGHGQEKGSDMKILVKVEKEGQEKGELPQKGAAKALNQSVRLIRTCRCSRAIFGLSSKRSTDGHRSHWKRRGELAGMRAEAAALPPLETNQAVRHAVTKRARGRGRTGNSKLGERACD